MDEVTEALSSTAAKVIEDYSEDPRGASCLILGFTTTGRPLHVLTPLALQLLLLMSLGKRIGLSFVRGEDWNRENMPAVQR